MNHTIRQIELHKLIKKLIKHYELNHKTDVCIKDRRGRWKTYKVRNTKLKRRKPIYNLIKGEQPKYTTHIIYSDGTFINVHDDFTDFEDADVYKYIEDKYQSEDQFIKRISVYKDGKKILFSISAIV